MAYDARVELRGVLDAVGDGIVIVDEALRVLNVNAACALLFDYPTHKLIGQPAVSLFVPCRERKVLASIRATLASSPDRRDLWEGHLIGRHRDGRRLTLEARIGRYLQQGLQRFVMALRDVGTHRDTKRALQRAAMRDPLTGVLNRTGFNEQLRHRTNPARQADRGFALLLLDLDHFKELNDRAGHAAGDLVLRQIARRLRDQIRQGDVVARLGGDEFAIIAPIEDPTDTTTLAERLVRAVSRPFHLDGMEAQVGASIGIAVFPQDSRDADLLLSRADLALYAAKSSGRDSWLSYDPELQAAAVRRRVLKSELHVAVRDRQLDLLYQPIVRVGDLQVCGFEALVRWAHPTRGVLGPDEFIAFAERNRLIEPITEWVLGRVIEDVSAAEEAFSGLPVAVNISTELFEKDSLLDTVARVGRRSRQPGSGLILEITEGALADHRRAAEILGELRGLGIGVAIDDFGSGYSSLARLKELPLDVLKIDQSLIGDLPGSAADRAIVDAIVRLASSLGMVTIAEGVETLAQLRGVTDLGCSHAQGFLIGQPVAVAQLSDWLAHSRLRERPRMMGVSGPRAPRLRLPPDAQSRAPSSSLARRPATAKGWSLGAGSGQDD